MWHLQRKCRRGCSQDIKKEQEGLCDDKMHIMTGHYIERFNTFSKNSHDNVRMIGSVRNEVINSVKTKGKEIDKAIEKLL